MRFPAICAFALAALAPSASAASLSIVLDFEAAPSLQSVAEMKREFEGILKPSRLAFDYKTRRQAEQVASEDLVVVRFKGQCVLNPGPTVAESGTLGFSYTVGGNVQPFGEIDCDRVVRAVGSAVSAVDYLRSDELLGRALGRVLAHEIVHMLSGSVAHARDGVAYKELTGRMLIAPELHLAARDFARIHLDR
jgi:hypothetical protein